MCGQMKWPIGEVWSLPFNFVNKKDMFRMCVIDSSNIHCGKYSSVVMMT